MLSTYSSSKRSTYLSRERETHTLNSFHTLVASLSFGFCSHPPPSFLTTLITHFVKMIHATDDLRAGRVWSTSDKSNDTHTLTLFIPAPTQHRKYTHRISSLLHTTSYGNNNRSETIPSSDVMARLGLEAVALAWLSRAQA